VTDLDLVGNTKTTDQNNIIEE